MKTKILNTKNYISTSEASKLYFYSVRTIRYWCLTNKIKQKFKHANKWYVEKNSIKKILEEDY